MKHQGTLIEVRDALEAYQDRLEALQAAGHVTGLSNKKERQALTKLNALLEDVPCKPRRTLNAARIKGAKALDRKRHGRWMSFSARLLHTATQEAPE